MLIRTDSMVKAAPDPLMSTLSSSAEHLRRGYGAAAIVFYGACWRALTAEGFLDFYVLVDRYSDAMGSAAALGAWLLPPNAYHHAFGHTLGNARAKVAII